MSESNGARRNRVGPPIRRVVVPVQRNGNKTVSPIVLTAQAELPISPTTRSATPTPSARPTLFPSPVRPQPPRSHRDTLSESSSLTVDISADADDGVIDAHRVSVGATQSLYESATIGNSSAVIPSMIWHASKVSTNRLSHILGGDVSGFVCQELGWTQEEVEKRLSPEQTDAVASIIISMQSDHRPDHEFLLADEAGFGKGRILMAFALWCVRNDIFPVITTKYPSLFSNLWQDIRDIGAEDIFRRPFIINESVPVLDLRNNGDILFKSIPGKMHRDVVKNGKSLPQEFGAVMLTWSQMAIKNSAKIKFLSEFVQGRRCCFIGDESHNAIGNNSVIHSHADMLKKHCFGVVDTSATSSRDINNMSSYHRIFPWLGDLKTGLTSIPEKYGMWVSEFSVERAIRMGKMVRREIDTSSISLETVFPDDDEIAVNYETRDRFASIVSVMSDLSKRVSNICDEANNELEANNGNVNKPFWTLNFGSRLYLVSLQLEACMLADLAVKRAIMDIDAGYKPMLIMDMTMESVFNAINNDENNAEDEEPELDGVDDNTLDNDMAREPISIHDLLYLLLDKILIFKRGSDVYTANAEQDSMVQTLYDEAKEMIAAFPAMTASPIDSIREGIEREGARRFARGEISEPWLIGELSGRSIQIGRDGKYVPHSEERNSVISKYNNGHYIGVIATSAASTGASMHHSDDFKADAPRSQIEVIGCKNPIERKQMWLRIYRRGSKSLAKYSTICSGTPYSLCRLAIENAKAKKLNASVSGDMNHGMLIGGEDILTPAANHIARDFLIANKEIARHLNIDVDNDKNDDDTWFVRKMFSRSMLLDSGIAASMLSSFQEALSRSNRHAANISITHIGEGWNKAPTMDIIEPGTKDSGNELMDGHVGAITIERYVPFEGLSVSELPQRTGEYKLVSLFSGPKFEKGYKLHLLTHKPNWAKSVSHALSCENDRKLWPNVRRNPCVIEQERVRELIALADKIGIGEAFIMPDKYGESRPGIIKSIETPDDIFSWSEYVIEYHVPGDNEVYVCDAKIFFGPHKAKFIADNDIARSRFNVQESGMRKESMSLISGNDIRACILASRAKVGRKVRYVDVNGREHSAITVNTKESKVLFSTPLLCPSPAIAYELMVREKCGIYYKGSGSKPLLSISINVAGGLSIHMSGNSMDQRPMEPLRVILAGITGQKRDIATFSVASNNIGAAMDAVFRMFNMSYDAAYRKSVMMMTQRDLENEPENRIPAPSDNRDMFEML